MVPRLPMLAVLTLLALPRPGSAQAGPPERVCRIMGEYTLLLAGLRDDGVPRPDALAALRLHFSPDPADLPSETNAARIAEAVYAHPELGAEVLAGAAGSQCLDSLRARG